MGHIDYIYDEITVYGIYDPKYDWKNRGKIETNDWYRGHKEYVGSSLDFCEYLSAQLRRGRHETYIVFTREDSSFAHASVIYRENEDDKYYIADPITDIKEFTRRGLDIPDRLDFSELTGKERRELASKSKNKRIELDEYIKEF